MKAPGRLFGAGSALLFSLSLVHVSAVGPADTAADQVKAREIEVRADALQKDYKAERREMTLTLINAQGQQSVRKVTYESLEGADRQDKTLISFAYPPDMKGVSLLTYEHTVGDDDQWLYLPSMQRVKRIASSNKSGSFMGSEFAYEDLVVRQLEKFDYRYLREEVVDGKRCHVIERLPRDKNSGYSKIVRWRLADNLQELKSEFYDRKGELLKFRVMDGHHQVAGIWRVKTISVTNVQTNKKSVLSFDEIAIKIEIPPAKFKVQSLESRG
jgi:hypothetical protein